MVSMTLLCLLMPITTWRLFSWLLQPAGSGVVRRTLGGPGCPGRRAKNDEDYMEKPWKF
jgi:hypothetical protein